MSKFTTYKKNIKSAIEKGEPDKIGQILSQASPTQRPKLREYARMYAEKQRDSELKALKTYKTKKKSNRSKTTSKITKSLYNPKARHTTKSAKTILKGFRLA
jgi:ribonuclease D